MENFDQTLQDLVDLKKPLTPELVTAMVLDITRGLLYLHARGLCVKKLALCSVAVVGNDLSAKLIVTPTTITEVTDGSDDIPALSRLISKLVSEVWSALPRVMPPECRHTLCPLTGLVTDYVHCSSKNSSSSEKDFFDPCRCPMTTKTFSRNTT